MRHTKDTGRGILLAVCMLCTLLVGVGIGGAIVNAMH